MKISLYRLSACFIGLLLLLNSTTGFSQSNGNHSSAVKPLEISNVEHFDATIANNSLSLIKANTTSEHVKDLQAALLILNKFQQQAKKCIDTNTLQLDKLNQRLNEITTPTPLLERTKDSATSEERKYLNDKKEELTNQLSECRLFSLRADEATADLSQKLRNVVTIRLLYAHPSLLKNLTRIPASLENTWQSFNTETFKDESGLRFFENANVPLLILPLLVILAMVYSNNRLKKKIIRLIGDATEISFSLHLKQALIAILSRYLAVFTGTFVLVVFFSVFTHSLITPSYLALACYAFLSYIVYLSLIRFYFYPPLPAEGFTSLPRPVAKTLVKRLAKFGMLSLTTYLIYMVFSAQQVDRSLIDLFRSVIITLFAINLISIVWAVKNFQMPNHPRRFIRFLASFVLISFLLFVLATEYLGYHLLASYFLFGAAMTVLVTFFTRLASKLIALLFDTLKNTDHLWQQKLRAGFGLKQHESLAEIFWLRALVYTLLWLSFLTAMLKIWGLAQANFQLFMNYLFYGFDVGKLHIIPLRIIEGALFVIIFSLLTRWFRTYIVKKSNWQLEAGGKESLASIIGYLGFAIAFILGALIAGVNFSGLALVAGALAVGIGFGLQNIVNNFVSGIILLIERPIKLGDRIVIGQTEGFVRKISIRSTHINTPQCSDVIVPNSELISQQVVNYMLHDMNCKVTTSVGVAYDSDIDLTKNVLLSIAKTHPQVITHQKDIEPIVYFKTFGPSSLNFDLVCVIKDVNMRAQVISDLNFSIAKTFKEKGIEIAFPQTDIRIKEWPKDPM